MHKKLPRLSQWSVWWLGGQLDRDLKETSIHSGFNQGSHEHAMVLFDASQDSFGSLQSSILEEEDLKHEPEITFDIQHV